MRSKVYTSSLLSLIAGWTHTIMVWIKFIVFLLIIFISNKYQMLQAQKHLLHRKQVQLNLAIKTNTNGLLMKWHNSDMSYFNLNSNIIWYPKLPSVFTGKPLTIVFYWKWTEDQSAISQGCTKCGKVGTYSQAHWRNWQAHYPSNCVVHPQKYTCKLWHCSNGSVPRHKKHFMHPLLLQVQGLWLASA